MIITGRKPGFLFLTVVFGTMVNCAATATLYQQAPLSRVPLEDVSGTIRESYSSLVTTFGKNKRIPESYKYQIIYALSFFPELVQTKIDFRVKQTKGGIISTRPTMGSLLRRSRHRRYIVIINDSTAGRTLPTFKSSNVNGQVGILGHELCHITNFNKMTGLGLANLGVSHVSTRYIDRFEYKTDSMTIERGLGYQLLDWKQYMDRAFTRMRGSDTVSVENPKMRHRYMSVVAIRRVIAKSKLYGKRNGQGR